MNYPRFQHHYFIESIRELQRVLESEDHRRATLFNIIVAFITNDKSANDPFNVLPAFEEEKDNKVDIFIIRYAVVICEARTETGTSGHIHITQNNIISK